MPIRIEIREAERLRVVVVEGALGDVDVYETFSTLWLAPDYDPTLDELVDLSGLSGLGVTTSGIRRLGETSVQVHRGSPAVRVAIVAPDNLVYGLSRMYGAFAEESGSEHRVFRSLEEAMAWLKQR
jgi:hypothetical protein